MTTQHIKQVILAEQKFDFLKELVNNIPDVQSEEGQDGSGGSGTAGRSTPDIDKPRKKRGRPRKAADAPDDGTGGPTRPKRGRPPKKKVQEPEAGSSEEETEENDTETGDEEDDDENEDEDDDSNHRNHDNHTGGSTGSGGDFTPGGAPPPGTDGATGGGGETGNNTQPAGLPFAGYTLPTTVSPQNHPPAVVGNQGNPSATFSTAQASEIPPPLVSGAPAPPGGSINNTVVAEKAQVSNSTVAPENDASRAGDCAARDLPTDNPVNSATNLTTSSTTETDRNSPSSVSTTATSASQPDPIVSVKSNTCPENSNDSNSKETANDSRKSPVTVPSSSNATPDSKGDTAATATSVSDSVANGATSVSGADAKEATTALTSATTTVTSSAATDKKQQDKSSALKEDEDSNHSSDSEVAAQVGSQAMNMIMSGYDPEKAQSVAASAAMNMIKDQYNNKLVDLKLSSSSPMSRTAAVRSIVNSDTKPKIESTVTNHSIANMVKHEPQSTKGLLSSPGGPPTSESVPSFVKKELDLKHVNMLEGGARAPHGQGPPPLVPTKKDEPPAKEDSREEEPMDMNTDPKSPASPVQNHASPSLNEGSPKPGTPSAYSMYERPSSSGLLQAQSIAVSSPSAMEKSQWSHLTAAAGAPYGLLGAYRPMMPGMAGMQFARMPTMMNQHMMAAPAGLYAHPGLVAAGHAGLQLQGASAMPAAIPAHLASAYAMAGGVGGVRYAAAPHAAAYMQAAMMPTMHAATGPYSHLGVPGQDAYLAALGMGVGIQPTAAAAQYANPSAAATAIYPQLQLAQAQAQAQLSQAQAQAQAQAAPQYAMYSQARGVPYQGFLPRPPT